MAEEDPDQESTANSTLSRMLAGNRRFAEGHSEHPWQDMQTRESLIDRQNPDAAVLSCSDSRVPPEIIFDAGLGDLFTIRTAGQIIDDAVLASLEYAVDHLHVSLLMVMGHEGCGAVALGAEQLDALIADSTSDPRLKAAIDMVSDGTFSNGDRNTYAPLVADWLTKDWFMTLADFTAYSSIQSEIEALYRDPLEWNRKAVLNVANSGYFSSDRSIQDYLDNIWHTSPLA